MLILVILNLIKSLETVWVHPTEVYIFNTLKFQSRAIQFVMFRCNTILIIQLGHAQMMRGWFVLPWSTTTFPSLRQDRFGLTPHWIFSTTSVTYVDSSSGCQSSKFQICSQNFIVQCARKSMLLKTTFTLQRIGRNLYLTKLPIHKIEIADDIRKSWQLPTNKYITEGLP